MTVAAQLQALRADFRSAQEAAERLAASVGDAEWGARPAGGGWSAAECITHLTLTTNAYLPLFAAARARADARAPMPRHYTRGFLPALLEWSLEPPARMRTKTLPSFVPGAAAPKAHTLAEFVASQTALLALIADVERVPLTGVILASPFNEKLHYNGYAALRILAAHQRRHLWQAARATRGVP